MTVAPPMGELDAVAALAARLGLGPVTPVVLGRARHVVVRLDPCRLVARLAPPSGTDPQPGLAREVAVALHLAARHAPVVRPAACVDPGPHRVGPHAMTLWEFVPHAAVGEDRAWAAALALGRLHAGLATYGADLPRLEHAIDACAGLLVADVPALPAEDRAFLAALHARLRADLDGMAWRPVPIHGDAHLGNALLTHAGVVWTDLEAACLGPREWDIASLPPGAWPAFQGADPSLLDCLSALRGLCVALWCWAGHGRSRRVDEAACYHLGALRERFGQR